MSEARRIRRRLDPHRPPWAPADEGPPLSYGL